MAIISVELDKPEGHSSPARLQRLQLAGEGILRTDRDGAVHVLTDGKHITVGCNVICAEAGAGASSVQAQSPDQQ
jgi:beta-lactamase superfamily II metal-dependent hydrolase